MMPASQSRERESLAAASAPYSDACMAAHVGPVSCQAWNRNCKGMIQRALQKKVGVRNLQCGARHSRAAAGRQHEAACDDACRRCNGVEDVERKGWLLSGVSWQVNCCLVSACT